MAPGASPAALGHEAAFAKAFMPSEKRARFIQYLANPKRRKEMLERLNHQLPYLEAHATVLPGDLDFPEALEKLVRSKGAGDTCHVTADGLKADGRTLPLREALHLVCLHPFGAILSFIPGRLAYYKPEAPAPGILFERT